MRPTCTEVLRVFPCDPAGALRESLASLLIRTARENDASPAQLLQWKFAAGTGFDGLSCSARALGMSIGQSINGSGATAGKIVRRAEQLTQLSNLRASTTLSFAPFATMNGLLRQRLAWSADSLQTGNPKYYPLLWALDPVRACPSSKKPLTSLCPECRKPLSMLSGGSRIGICNRCGSAIDRGNTTRSSVDPVASSVRSLDYEVWIAEQLGEYIRFQVDGSLPADFSYGEVVRFWFDKFSLVPSNQAARDLGCSQISMATWLHSGAIPRLRTTLNLCWVFGLSLLQFLQKRPPKTHDGKLRKSIDGQRRQVSISCRRKIDKAALERNLSAILRENRYAMLPFSQICQDKLHRRDLVVRQNFGDLSRAIARRYLTNRKLMAQVRQEQFCAGIKAYSRALHARGMVPNHKTLTPFVDRPSKLRCEWAIRAMREVRAELGYENKGEQLLLAV